MGPTNRPNPPGHLPKYLAGNAMASDESAQMASILQGINIGVYGMILSFIFKHAKQNCEGLPLAETNYP